MLSAWFAAAVFSQVSANVQPVFSSDCASCDGMATVTTLLPGDVTFQWFDQNGNLLFSEISGTGISQINDLCAGLYQVQLTNGLEGEQHWFAIATSFADAGAVGQLTACESTGSYQLYNSLVNPMPGGDWFDPAGQPHNGTFISAQQPGGTYVYQVNSGGCTLTTAVAVNLIQNADPGLSATYLICETYDPFELIDVLAGVPDEGGQWYNAAAEPIDGFYYPDSYETSLFTYELNIVDGCPPVFSTLFVIENQLPDPGIDTELAVCPNAISFDMTEQLFGTPDGGGNWFDENGDEISNIFDPLLMDEGAYTYVVSGATPCPNREADLTITFTEGISSGEDAVLELCENDPPVNLTDALGGTPTLGGVWTNPQGEFIDATIDPSNAISGQYTYTVSAVGCQPEFSVIAVNIASIPNPGAGGVTSVCETQGSINPADLLDADTGLNGVWLLNGEEVQGALVLESNQTYTLTYFIDGGGCPDAQSNYQVQVDAQPEAMLPPQLNFCANDPLADLSEQAEMTAGFPIEWTDSQGMITDGLFDPSSDAEGSYTLTLFSENNCPDASTGVMISVEESAFLSEAVTIDDCLGGQTYDLNDLLPPDFPESGQWSFEGNEVNTVIPANVAANGIYEYTIDNGNACGLSVFTVQLEFTEPLEAGVGEDLVICSTEPPFSLENQLQGASSQGEWVNEVHQPVDPLLDPGQTDSGTYIYTVPAVGPCPADSAFIQIEIQQGLVFSAGPDLTVCEDEGPVTFETIPCADCVYNWEGFGLDDAASSQPSFVLPDVIDTDNFSFTVTAENGACVAVDQVNVTVHPVPDLAADGPAVLCAGEAGFWTAEGAADYLWSTEGGEEISGNSIEATFFESTEIIVNGTNATACSSTLILPVNVLPLPDLQVSIAPAEGCEPLTVELPVQFPDAEADYWWEIDGEVIPAGTAAITFEEPGLHDIQLYAEGANACVGQTDFIEIAEVFALPDASFTFDRTAFTVLQPEVFFENTTTGAEFYLWDFSGLGVSEEASPSFSFPDTEGQGYRVCLEANSSEGCIATHCEELFIGGQTLVYVPNAFTPDMDGVNDVFFPIISGFSPEEYRFAIFNRWGEEIFATSEPGAWWNGSVNGGAYFAQNGVYTWLLEFRDRFSAQKRRMTGSVVLIR